ncbi:7169_t:CDS:2 [Diversispora eburnea]|uniref:7169_t:CDS:1 n=1 Tax=Diversispora eburnea TaxID=1213867 RepID=A0A9N9BAV9_9GLOM|nr:7169_t:CDS:2 [Diversispora eburnea]
MSLSYDKKDVLRMAIDTKLIKSLDYETFENFSHLGRGAFGTVERAYSKFLRKEVALKSINSENEDEFYRELKNILEVNQHDNIIKLFGISKEPLTDRCLLVLQYANDGDLRSYLTKNFEKLDWKKKINMAKDIALGLYYIHAENIAHRDLHSKNILVNEGRLLIADLGLSQPLDSNSNSILGGMMAYTDPRYLRNTNYKRNKTSDIYSLGVLFWELSSGKPPFKEIQNLDILRRVKSGDRETPINGTPVDYIKIYSNAWSDAPEQRPNVEKVLDDLENIQLENVYNNYNNDQLQRSQKYQSLPSFQFEADDEADDVSMISATFPNTCIVTLNKIKEQFKFYDLETSICDAHLHIVLGDIEGLQWHLNVGFDENSYYGPMNLKRNLYDFAIKYCNKEDIMKVFNVLNVFHYSKLNLNIQLLFSNDNIRIPQDLRDIMKLIVNSRYDINCKNRNSMYTLYSLLQSIDNNIYDIIEIYLENGFDPNNPFNDTLPNLLFFAVYKNYPNEILELIFKQKIDLKKKNKYGLNILGYTASTENFEIKVKSLIENLKKKIALGL